MNWFDSTELEHIGFIEFGFNSITEIEVYQNKYGKLLFCDHDDPDTIYDINYIKECVSNCNDSKYDEQVSEAERICGQKLR